MRDYAKVVPTFWTGETGKALRRAGSEAVIVGMYLMTSPGSNMLGLYYQPILYMAHETGLGLEGASKGLNACIDAGFCRYDHTTETVWVREMAAFQVARELKASDNRCAGIQKDYDGLPDNPFLGEFFDIYEKRFHLANRRSGRGPSKPLRSQEQEQEQEKEQDQDQERTSSLRSESSSPSASTPAEPGAGEGAILSLVPPAPSLAKRQARIEQIAAEAQSAYNAILAKPNGLLPLCAVINKPRRKAVEKALPTVRQICAQLYGNERVTPKFWQQYFETAAADDFHSGRSKGGPGHENWKPDFEFLLRETTIAKLFDRAMSEAQAA